MAVKLRTWSGGLTAPLLLLTLALALRLGVVAATDERSLVADPLDYHRHAASIAATGGYPETAVAPGGGPTALRPPAYPSLLAVVYEFTGARPLAGRVLQALIGTLNVALVAVLAGRLWGRRVGITAGALAAAFPPMLMTGASLLVEPLFVSFLLAALLAVLQYRSTFHLRWALAGGVLAGLAALTRGNGLVLLLPLALGAWAAAPRLSWRPAAAPAMLLAGAVLTVAPWTVRNAIAFDAFVPLTTQAGYNLAGTYSERARTDPRYPGAWRPAVGYLKSVAADAPGELELERRLRAAAADHAAANPLYVAYVGYRNARRLMHLESFSDARKAASIGAGGIGPPAAEVAVLSFYAVALAALVGLGTGAARRAPLFLWLTPALLFLSVIFIHGGTRFRAPIDPFIVLLAALALTSLGSRAAFSRRFERRQGRPRWATKQRYSTGPR